MRYIVLTILPFLAIFLQSTLFSSYSIKGSIPDLLLIFVAFFALFNGSKKGVVYGMLCGLLEDLYVGRLIGINILAKGITAYVIGKFQINVFKENILVGILAVVIATILNSTILIFITLISYDIFHIDISILTGMIYQTIYNTIIAMPVYIWYYNSTRDGWLREIEDL